MLCSSFARPYFNSESSKINASTQFFSIGEGPAAFVISAEVFPLIVRELGMSLAVGGRVGAFLFVHRLNGVPGLHQFFLSLYTQLLHSVRNAKSSR